MTKKKTAKKPKVVTISRKRWSDAGLAKKMEENPKYPGWEQGLLTDSGHMCCLGFVSRSCVPGVVKDDLFGTYLPSGLDGDIPEWLRTIQERAATINDDQKITRRERESKLKKLFEEKTPIRLRFVP